MASRCYLTAVNVTVPEGCGGLLVFKHELQTFDSAEFKFSLTLSSHLPYNLLLTFPEAMTNFQDTRVLQVDASEPLYLSHFRVSSSTVHSSVLCQTPSCHGGDLYVRHYLIFLASRDNSSRWEYLTTLQFEWEIVTGKRKYRWTILVRSADHIGLWSPPDTRSRTGAKLYSGCRLSTLLAIILIFFGVDTTTQIDCKVGGVSVPLSRRFTQPVHLAANSDFYICAFCWCPELCSRSSDDIFCFRFSPISPWHFHPPSSCSACKSALAGSSYEILRCLPGHRVAIWERNLVVSTIAVAGWLISIAFYIRRTFFLCVTNFCS